MTVLRSALQFSTCALALCAASPALAFEITGGDVALGYSELTDAATVSTTSLEGSVEVGFTRSFAVQLDAANYSFGLNDEDVTNFTIHALYHINDTFSAGAFLGQDTFNGSDLILRGFEVGREFSAFDLEAYVASAEDDGDKGLLYGFEGRYDLANGVFLGASFDETDLGDDLTLTNIAARVGYAISESFDGSFEVGHVSYETSSAEISEPYFGLAVEFKFGADRGATFGERSTGSSLPAF